MGNLAKRSLPNAALVAAVLLTIPPSFASMDYLRWEELNDKGKVALHAGNYAQAEQSFRQAIEFSEAQPYGAVTACELKVSYALLLSAVKRQHKFVDCPYCYRGVLVNDFFAHVFILDPYLLTIFGSITIIGTVLFFWFVCASYRAYVNKKSIAEELRILQPNKR